MTASGHESGGGDRVTRTGHDDPPGEQGKANACAGTGSGQKTETGPGEAGSSPKTATCQGGIHDPSVFLGQKTGKHGRIENGSFPPKAPPTHHLAERAVMSGESQPRKKRSGQQATAAREPLLDLQPAKELRRQKRAHPHRTSVQRHFHPSRWTHGEREERKPHGKQHKVIPRPPPPHLSRPSEGREEDEGGAAGCVTSAEVPARGEVVGAGGREEPEGRDDLLCLAKDRI